ncbi:MAG: dipeptidyl aminopeptidase/acylaminoacyl peptidase [Oceanicoccus sp.]|jgi:dipeptidyl aminopeptidase/acylaminoacyl peptidase
MNINSHINGFVKREFRLHRVRFFLSLFIFFTSMQVLSAQENEISFTHAGNTLVGTLMLPEIKGPHRIVLFVHGDGPTERDNYGVYRPLWDAFLAAGFGIYSWDKAGVGQSTGDWQSQNMSDRADELIAAGQALTTLENVDVDSLGIWGISQAGWVVPMAVTQSDIFDWTILVSGAINWMDQSRYLTEHRMRHEGFSELDISKALALERHSSNSLIHLKDYEQYKIKTLYAPPCCNQVMSEQRWRFVRKNVSADVTPYLSKINIPVLGIFGEFDANVDIHQSKKIYQQEIQSSLLTLKTFRNADHGIMPSNKMKPAGMKTTFHNIYQLLRIDFMGAKAYAPGYVSTMVLWASQQYKRTEITCGN